MSIVNTDTGEVVEYDRPAAERRAERIRLRLDSIADNYAAVMPMIREAIEKRDDQALGYRSPSEYVADRFGGALTRLGVEVRREVVRELTAAGMSTRAIAPVVGTSHETVRSDVRAGVKSLTPDPEPDAQPEPTPAPEPKPVTGIDGKTYTRPEPKAAPRKAITDSFFDAFYDLGKSVERVERLTADDRFPRNAEQVAAKHRSDLTRAVEALSRVLDQFDNN